jgi:hypothetical protein
MNLKYTVGQSSKFSIIQGLVVPEDSVVVQGLAEHKEPLSNEAANALFKILFGIRKRKIIVQEEEDDTADIIKVVDSDSEGSAAVESDESDAESEEKVEEDED